MKEFNWDEAKNAELKAQRGISFEDVVFAIANDGLLDDLAHPNPRTYGHQRVLVVVVDDYIYVVPYVEDESELFLKTAFPSRKFTKQYLGGGDDE